MARMLNERESADRHLNLVKRHIRLCRQANAGKYADAIKPAFDELTEKQKIFTEKLELREAASDDIVFCDAELDNSVRTTFEKCKQHDRDNPGQQITARIFPQERFSHIVNMNRMEEPVEVERLAVKFESLGKSHALYTLAAFLRQKIAPVQQAIERYYAAVRDMKMAEAEIEIAQVKMIRQYETNYLEARKDWGKEPAERLFPKTTNGKENVTEPLPLPVPAQTA
jgi:hypothetical protein